MAARAVFAPLILSAIISSNIVLAPSSAFAQRSINGSGSGSVQVVAQRGQVANILKSPASVNSGVVGIISGEANSTALAMTGDLASVLDQSGFVRIIPMIGQGPEQTVRDILYLRGTDVGIVRSDILNHLKKQSGSASLNRRLHFITKLHNEEVHILARMNYLCLSDLAGKTVNFGRKGSGGNVTSSLIFDAHKVAVKPVFLDQASALSKLKTGEIDATVIVSGKPSPIFNSIKYTDRVHFLDVEFAGPLTAGYIPSVMSFDDYPDLVARNETVSTISVAALMAVYNWKPQTDRYEKVARFVDVFFKNFKKFKQSGHHVKWREVEIGDDVPGWTRFRAAQNWLVKNRPDLIPDKKSPSSVKASFQQFLSQKNARNPAKKKMSEKEQESLFNQFVGWMKNQADQ